MPASRLLLFDLGLGFGRGHHTPHLIEGVHVEGQIVDLAMVVGHRAVGVAVELCKLVHILPHSLVVGVEDMCTVAVDIDALHRLRVDIACNVAALIDHKALLACLFCFLGKHRTIKACTYDQVIVLFHGCAPLCSFFFDIALFLRCIT